MIQAKPSSHHQNPVMLLSGIGKILGHRMTGLLEPTGLKPRHMRALMTLREAPHSQQALAEKLGTHPAKLVALLNDLEAQGLVGRRRDPGDRRRHTVTLLEEGRSRLEAVDVAMRTLETSLFARLDQPQQVTLVELLERVAGSLGVSVCEAVETDACDESNGGSTEIG